MECVKQIRRTTTNVRSTQDQCPACGDVPITNDEILVRLCVDNPLKHHYVFACPTCEMPVVRLIEQKVLDALIFHGCPMEKWHMPREIFEKHPVGKAFTNDDLLDMHVLLTTTDLIASLVADRDEAP